MNIQELENLAKNCATLAEGVESNNPDAIRAARRMLWVWVDKGTADELTYLLLAIKAHIKDLIGQVQTKDDAALDEAKTVLWKFSKDASPEGLAQTLKAIRLMAIQELAKGE